MNDLIPLDQNDDGTVAVSMRALHAGLDVGRDFTTWARQMFAYGFEDGTDYVEASLPQSGERTRGGQNRRDWALTLDAAKEIAMVQRTERGQQVRRYFIEKEKELRAGAPALTGPALMAAALIEAQNTLAAKDRELESARPKADAYDAFMDADGCYSVGAVAKMLNLGQQRLFDELYARKVLIATGHLRKTPYSHYMHHFHVSLYTYENSKTGQVGISYTTKVRPSGVNFIRKKLGMASAPMLDVA